MTTRDVSDMRTQIAIIMCVLLLYPDTYASRHTCSYVHIYVQIFIIVDSIFKPHHGTNQVFLITLSILFCKNTAKDSWIFKRDHMAEPEKECWLRRKILWLKEYKFGFRKNVLRSRQMQNGIFIATVYFFRMSSMGVELAARWLIFSLPELSKHTYESLFDSSGRNQEEHLPVSHYQ